MKQFDLERWQKEFVAQTGRLDAIGDWPGPGGGAWSAASCIEHLEIAAKEYLQVWREALAGTGGGGKAYAFWWRWFLERMGQPGKMKIRTTERFEPRDPGLLEVHRKSYRELRQQVWQLAPEAARKGSIKVRSPFAGWLKYPLDYSFDLWLAHEHRHLCQAERLKPGNRETIP